MQDKSDTILIISGDNACFNALNDFASAFSFELSSLGYKNEVRNISEINMDILNAIAKENFRAIVGFQTNFFTLRFPGGPVIAELLPMPKYNFVLDPPASKLSYFSYDDPTMNLLIADEGYVDFIRTYFPGNKKVHFLPPGGGLPQLTAYEPVYTGRPYDLTFMGTYNDYRVILERAAVARPDFTDIILGFFQYMLEHPNTGAETAIVEYLSMNKIVLETDDFLKLFELLYVSEQAVTAYYRETVISTLLKHHIKVDVFSDSWYGSPFAADPCLTIHEALPYADSFEIYRKSKLSLNIFSWHKNMMSERVANIMISGAVCVSDYSPKLDSLFANNDEIVLFDLTNPDMAAASVSDLLQNDNKRMLIARKGYENVLKNHLWKNRVESFVSLL